MKKSYRCYINIEGLDKTSTGKRKVWHTDNIETYCCCVYPSLFIWEKASKCNGYDPYHGYVKLEHVEILA